MPELPRRVGRYELLEVLGQGAAGTVYRACQTDLGRLVAVKELSLRNDREIARRFLREAQIGGALMHRNIVAVHEYLEHEGGAYIAMELLPRGSLRAHAGPVTIAQAGGVLEGVLAALEYAASRVVHRDIKPDNVLVGDDGWVKLADFGIARAIDAAAAGTLLTATGAILGTPAYMAPEQAKGQGIGPWTDLYAAGAIAYELLVGDRPRPPAANQAHELYRLLSEPIRPPLELRPSLDAGLAAWLERMLQPEPADRYPSAAIAWDELEDHLDRLLDVHWQRMAALTLEPAEPLPAASTRISPAIEQNSRRSSPQPLRPESRAPSLPAGRTLPRQPPETTPPASDAGPQPPLGPLVKVAVPLAFVALLLAVIVLMIAGRYKPLRPRSRAQAARSASHRARVASGTARARRARTRALVTRKPADCEQRDLHDASSPR